MEPLLALAAWFLYVDHGADPVQAAWKGRQEMRQLDCTRMPQPLAHQLYPDRIPEEAPRAPTLMTIDALVCARRVVPFGEGDPRDEAILTTLRENVDALAQGAAASAADTTTWYVDAFYPEPSVGARIAVAARTSLAERGAHVSNRVPILAAGDLVILRHVNPADALPIACGRYYAEGVLKEGEGLFAVVLVDPRETVLHGGVCVDGKWRWLS